MTLLPNNIVMITAQKNFISTARQIHALICKIVVHIHNMQLNNISKSI